MDWYSNSNHRKRASNINTSANGYNQYHPADGNANLAVNSNYSPSYAAFPPHNAAGLQASQPSSSSSSSSSSLPPPMSSTSASRIPPQHQQQQLQQPPPPPPQQQQSQQHSQQFMHQSSPYISKMGQHSQLSSGSSIYHHQTPQQHMMSAARSPLQSHHHMTSPSSTLGTPSFASATTTTSSNTLCNTPSSHTYSSIGGIAAATAGLAALHRPAIPMERNSYYYSQYPLYACDWASSSSGDLDCIALGSYKEGLVNKLEIVYGQQQQQSQYDSPGLESYVDAATGAIYDEEGIHGVGNGFFFERVAEVSLDYPITHLKWDPAMLKTGGFGGGQSPGPSPRRLAASSEVLRLYKMEYDYGQKSMQLKQTHVLANNTSTNISTSGALAKEINTYPPVTSFDWNERDENIIITSSVDTTCTVWDLNRPHPYSDIGDTATVKTQLIAHDSEVFDVKFIHKSANVFASVGNDGSMRVFDLRSLEHSTIIYEPAPTPVSSNPSLTLANTAAMSHPIHSVNYNSKALLSLTTSNIDQHHVATVGVNSNQIIIIDMRMPGVPLAIIDASTSTPIHARGVLQQQQQQPHRANSNPSGPAINSIEFHPTSNFLLSGGDDCQALVWDINNLNLSSGSASSTSSLSNSGGVQQTSQGSNGSSGGNASANANSSAATGSGSGTTSAGAGYTMDVPVLAFEEELEVNKVCWRQSSGDYMGVVSGKGFQAVSI
ncbi:uncharacterized protein LODBEIA_P05080 [Lodderomyces beijingensis]|uniref:WD40 repeat-like protein n=1 Tax=Lodderomyces beijingensis TaxID=1775926 RepID=A0ABP0ZDL9_9ASCO